MLILLFLLLIVLLHMLIVLGVPCVLGACGVALGFHHVVLMLYESYL
jgi:hypothetical protein